MSFLIKDYYCDCGGSIEVIGHKDKPSYENNYNPKTLVSHGVCTECLRNIVLPTEDYEWFIQQNCEWRDI